MAAPSPEGEAWFLHAALKLESFDPANPKDFYNHILLEVVTNHTVDNNPPNLPYDHPRTGAQVWNPNARTAYVRYKHMPVMTGKSCNDIKRNLQVHGSFDYWDLNGQSGKTMVALVPVIIPDINERFLWVDLTYPLRGIYIPKSHLAHPKYNSYCTYSRLDFRSRKVTLEKYTGVDRITMDRLSYDISTAYSNMGSAPEHAKPGIKKDIARMQKRLNELVDEPDISDKEREGTTKLSSPWVKFKKEEMEMAHDATTGWGRQATLTARFDILCLPLVLAIPNHLLKAEYQDPYQFIKIFDCRCLSLRGVNPTGSTMNPKDVVGFDKLVSNQLGIDFKYKDNATDPNWLVKVLAAIGAVALSCIPMIGPLLALEWQLGVDAILDPESFQTQQGLIEKIPNLVTGIVGTGLNTKSFLSNTASPSKGAAVFRAGMQKGEKKAVYVGPDKAKAEREPEGQEKPGQTKPESEKPWIERDLSNLTDVPPPHNPVVLTKVT
jgi:hypothetical protein